MKRILLIAVLILPLVAVWGVLFGQDWLLDRLMKQQLTRADVGMLTDGRIHVVTVGTGTPNPTEERVGACVAVIANGEFLMFDAGPGSVLRADMAGLPLDALSTVFITHLHSDHFAGLGQTINHSWVWGRREPLTVYGPAGIETVVEGFRMAYARDVELRNEHVGEDASPLAGAHASAHAIDVVADNSTMVFERKGIRVYAFAVDHGIVKPALGYRIEVGGRRVVISGDLKRDERLIVHAEDADLLIHEAYRTEMVMQVADAFERLGKPERAHQARSTQDYHAHPHDAADIAHRAGVKHLVFTHVIPPPLNPLVTRRILDGVDERFSGPVTIADDGQRFVLEPVSS